MLITKECLENKVRRLQSFTGLKYTIEYASQPIRPRVYEVLPSGGMRDLSPRLSKPELYRWLDAYIEGLRQGWELRDQKGQLKLAFYPRREDENTIS